MVNREFSNSPNRQAKRPHFKDGDYPESMFQFFILKVWQRLLGHDDIGIDDDFMAAGGDAALSNQMLSTVQTAVGQQITGLLRHKSYTIRELEAVILREIRPPAELVTLAKHGYGTPLLFCHGDYAMRGLYALQMVQTLKSHHPAYLLHPYPNPNPTTTIEEMARAYVPEILARHPEGIFRLVGYCNGGQLAWEIAHQLERSNRQVEFIVLIETISLNARTLLRALGRLVKFISATAPRAIGEKVAREWMSFGWNRTCRLSTRNPYMPASTPYSRALRNYVPPKVNSPIICVLSDESSNRVGLSPVPWMNLAPRVDYRQVSGNHLNDLTALVSELTPILNELLTHADTRLEKTPVWGL